MSASEQHLTVLVADDDDDDRGLIWKAWRENRSPSQLRFVDDGEQLTDYLNHAGRYSDPASAPRPAMILLDLNMPRKDGREALREIKANPKLCQIPIIVLSTSQADEDICRSYELGANSYITKPVTFGALADVLNIVGKYWTEITELPPESPGALM